MPGENQLPAGDYVISDPSYVLCDDDYSRIIDETYCYSKNENHIFIDSKTGLKFCVFSTAWGDGFYYDNEGREYGVDAGVIGCIPIGMCSKDIGKYSHKESFANDFVVAVGGEHNGLLKFGDIIIDTD